MQLCRAIDKDPVEACSIDDVTNLTDQIMGLQAALESEFSSVDESTLPRIRDMIIQQLKAATKSFRHHWHNGIIASVDDGDPKLRTVVLRGVADNPLSLRFHTDLRSEKVAQLQSNPSVEWLFYHPATRFQLRAAAYAEVQIKGDAFDEAWFNTGVKSRRCYLGPFAPGARCEVVEHNLPPKLLNRDPTEEESEAGRKNFAIVQCVVRRLELLFLKHDGHIRCGFSCLDSGDWNNEWLAP